MLSVELTAALARYQRALAAAPLVSASRAKYAAQVRGFLLRGGAAPVLVADLLGHASLDTVRIYTNPTTPTANEPSTCSPPTSNPSRLVRESPIRRAWKWDAHAYRRRRNSPFGCSPTAEK